MKRSLCIFLIFLLLLPCGPRAVAEDTEGGDEIVIVTAPPIPEETPLPEETPEPTETEIPEETPAPTEIPTPTEAPTPTDTPEPTPTAPVLPTSIEIDTENWYFGMGWPYRDGYQPTIGKEIVTIILPLQSTDRLLDDKITVTLDLSATGTTFVIANYQKTVVLSEQNINGTEETREIFYVDFSIPLSSSRVNGSYPVRLQVKAYDLNYTPIEAVFTVYVNITDVPPKPTSTGGGAETPTAEPVVLIAHSDITPENVMAGEAFTVKLTLRNSLDTKLVRNMLLRVDTGNLQINLAEDSPVLQLESLDRGGESEIELHFSSDPSIPAGKYIINFTFSYDSNKTLNLSSSGFVIVEIAQPTNAELVVPRIPGEMTAGETIPLSFQVMNMGRDNLYNVRCVISGVGLFPSNTGFIGTMVPGSSSSTSVELFVGSKTMSDDYRGQEKYGETSGTVTLIYEDASGREYTEEQYFRAKINPPTILSDPSEVQVEVSAEDRAVQYQWWIIIGGLGLVVLGLVSTLIVKQRKRR